MNLLGDPWLPVRRASGALARIAPWGLTDRWPRDPPVALDFPRPDWNAAVLEWLTGVLGLAHAPADPTDWARGFAAPPSPAAVRAALAPFAAAFSLDGPDAYALQDFDPLPAAPRRPAAALLIDAPGEITVETNTDLFVKRGRPAALALPEAAAALITLQAYAPAGGKGHRASLRGGGPLTTLVVPRRRADPAGGPETTLWDLAWANTVERRTPPPPAAAALPWLRPTHRSEAGEAVPPDAAAPELAVFACPRRLRLVFGRGGGGERQVTGVRSRGYGARYLGWRHPLSPYRTDPGGKLVCVHPRRAPFSYADLPLCWGLEGAPAAVAEAWPARAAAAAGLLSGARLRVHGYDMDQMKARRWMEAEVPWPSGVGEVSASVLRLAAAGEAAGRALVQALRLVWQGRWSGRGYVLDGPRAARAGDLAQERFRARLDAGFQAAVDGLLRDPEAVDVVLEAWRGQLAAAAEAVFGETIDAVAEAARDARRLAVGAAVIRRATAPSGAVGRALGLAG